MDEGQKIRVLVADDHPMIREGIKATLQPYPDIECVGEVEDGAALLEVLRHQLPDVVLLDLNMPGVATDLVGYIRLLREGYPTLRVLVLTGYRHQEIIVSTLRAGASGYVLKDAVSATIVEAIREVMAGEVWLPPHLMGGVIERLRVRQQQDDSLASLTPREREVLRCLLQWEEDEDIANALGIAVNTVRTHRKNIYQKLGVHSRQGAMLHASAMPPQLAELDRTMTGE